MLHSALSRNNLPFLELISKVAGTHKSVAEISLSQGSRSLLSCTQPNTNGYTEQ